jgi:hypothetical protein
VQRMKRIGVVATILTLPVIVAVAGSAPAPVPRPVDKWEYAELRSHHRIAYENTAGALVPAKTTAAWTTSKAAVEAESWEDLATKLKAGSGGKAATDELAKLRVFDRLGDQGWELVGPPHRPGREETFTHSHIWSFKRRMK